MKTRLYTSLAGLLILCTLSACQISASAIPASETAIVPLAEATAQQAAEPSDIPAEPDPEQAMVEIYQLLPDASYEELSADRLAELCGITDISEFRAYYSDAKSGLADTVIVRVEDDHRDAVRELLYRYKEKRVSEFEKYDILDAYSIAQGAVIYDQGDYLVLLMLPDNAAAQQIIDQYIPL